MLGIYLRDKKPTLFRVQDIEIIQQQKWKCIGHS